MTPDRAGTVPLPLALHLASHTLIGLFCAFAGGLNLIDPVKIIPNGVAFLGLCGFSWGYVFGILMARREVLALGFVASAAYLAAGLVGAARFDLAWWLSLPLAAVGAYGLAVLAAYRRWIVPAPTP